MRRRRKRIAPFRSVCVFVDYSGPGVKNHYEFACKMDAYHRYIQLGVIAQGILVALATTTPGLVWRHFGSWFRTVREGVLPSERAVTLTLRNSYQEFLLNRDESPILVKLLQKRIDPDKAISKQWAA